MNSDSGTKTIIASNSTSQATGKAPESEIKTIIASNSASPVKSKASGSEVYTIIPPDLSLPIRSKASSSEVHTIIQPDISLPTGTMSSQHPGDLPELFVNDVDEGKGPALSEIDKKYTEACTVVVKTTKKYYQPKTPFVYIDCSSMLVDKIINQDAEFTHHLQLSDPQTVDQALRPYDDPKGWLEDLGKVFDPRGRVMTAALFTISAFKGGDVIAYRLNEQDPEKRRLGIREIE